jgi:SSS family solute:Na+ symporter
VGFAVDLWLWLAHPAVSWLWWNVVGFLATTTVALVVPSRASAVADHEVPFDREALGRAWWPGYATLAAWALVILGVMAGLAAAAP